MIYKILGISCPEYGDDFTDCVMLAQKYHNENCKPEERTCGRDICINNKSCTCRARQGKSVFQVKTMGPCSMIFCDDQYAILEEIDDGGD